MRKKTETATERDQETQRQRKLQRGRKIQRNRDTGRDKVETEAGRGRNHYKEEEGGTD